ncbi:MAG: NUDIX domain-containing protein [Bacteroidota bacterium]
MLQKADLIELLICYASAENGGLIGLEILTIVVENQTINPNWPKRPYAFHLYFGEVMIMEKTLAQAQQIKPVALCVFRKKDDILLEERVDKLTSEVFYRPLGGGLAFGEYSWETVRREIKKEMGEDIKNLTFIGPAESVFQREGNQGHEIIFMFEGEFVRSELYDKAEIIGHKSNGDTIKAVWKPISEFKKKKARLYPEGLLEMLQ